MSVLPSNLPERATHAGPPATRHRAFALLWCIAAAILWLFVLGHVDPVGYDFHSFHATSRAWWGLSPDATGAPLDLNTPIWPVLLWPLAVLPLSWAWAAWNVIGLACLSAILIVTPASNTRKLWLAGACLVTTPALAEWVTGQLAWPLALLITLAWRRESPILLGLAVILKPPLALLALALPWSLTWRAGAVSVGLLVLSLPVVGVSAWQAWLALGGQVTWLSGLHNQSLWAWAGRMALPTLPALALSDFPAWLVLVVLGAGLTLLPLVVRAHRDARWGLAVLWSLALSPLGWTYYLPLALGPMLASLRGPWAWIALACFLVPPPALPWWPILTLSLGGTVALWCGFSARTGVSYRDGS